MAKGRDRGISGGPRGRIAHALPSSFFPNPPPAMIHHLVLFQLKPEVTSAQVETMMRQTRAQLLKIDEVLAVQCGRAADPSGEWGFFFSIDCESLEKLTVCQENPIYLKYAEKVLKAHTSNSFQADFQTEPARDLR